MSVGDGRVSTAAVAGVLTGTRWAATIPAAALEGLANGTLTATARYTVPDVSSGAPSQIEGVPLTVTKVPAPAVSAGGAVQPVAATPDATVPTIARPSSARPVRLGRLVTSSRLSLAAARRTGIRATFVVPAGARIARLELRRGSRTVVARTISVRGGARHVVRLSGALLFAALLLVPLVESGHSHANRDLARPCATCVATHHSPAAFAPVVAIAAPITLASAAVFSPIVALVRRNLFYRFFGLGAGTTRDGESSYTRTTALFVNASLKR